MNGEYLVDTNIIIRLLHADERAIALFNEAKKICIPAIVAGELYYGAQNSTLMQENLDIFNDFLSQYEIVNVNLAIAETYGEIKAQLKKAGLNLPENDLWIAATAKTNQYTLLTNDSHFLGIEGLQVRN
ncbi:MAG: PIN domain-containing protein [Clostridiales bacterium]|nr:PIN domain-containing protein [Clostridiales bacterium]